MAAQPKKKTSKVRSKTRRAHRHDSIVDENLWQSGMLSKKERKEKIAQYRRSKSLKDEKMETSKPKATKAASKDTSAKDNKTAKDKKTTPSKKKE